MRQLKILLRIARDDSGQSMLETIIVFPVVITLMLLIMEVSLAYNMKQMANYAAFCAARCASVHGYESEEAKEKMQQAAAIALTGVSASVPDEFLGTIKSVFGFGDDFFEPVSNLLGGGNPADLIDNFAGANARLYIKESVEQVSGERRNITVEVAYVYRCLILPLGVVNSKPVRDLLEEMKNKRPELGGLYGMIIKKQEKRSIVIRGQAKMDYWAPKKES